MTQPASLAEFSRPVVEGGRRHPWFAVGFALLVIAIALALEYRWRPAIFHEGRVFFADPDDYLRLYRVRELLEGRGPVIRRLPDMNWPRGGELHWTAPMDYLLAGVLLVFKPLVGDRGMDAVAAWIPVGLGMVWLVVVMSGLARACGWPPALLMGFFTIIMRPFHRPFALGHPDHHCLLELLFAIAVTSWLTRREPDGQPRLPSKRAAIVSGIATGLALWVAPQAMAVWLPILAGLTVGGYAGSSRQRAVWDSRRITWCFFVWVVVVIGYGVENLRRLGAIEADKISLFHVTLVTLAFLIPVRLHRDRRRLIQGWLLPMIAAAGFATWLALRHDTIFSNMQSPEFFRWSGYIVELQPLWTLINGQWSLVELHDRLGLMPYLLPITLWFFLRSPMMPPAARAMFALLAIGFTVLSIFQRRWLDHVSLGLLAVTVVGLYEVSGRAFSSTRPAANSMRLLFTAACVVAAYAPCFDFLVKPPTPAPAALDLRTALVADRIKEYEKRNPAADFRRRAILSHDVSVLFYHTRLPAVSTPYHRTLEGLLEEAKFFAERDPNVAREQLRRLGVRYVVVPYRPHEVLMSLENIAFGELRSYEPPVRSIDAAGLLQQELRYKPEIAETMIYRLAMNSGQPPAGMECIAVIKEGAETPGGYTGLVYVVKETGATSSAPAGRG